MAGSIANKMKADIEITRLQKADEKAGSKFTLRTGPEDVPQHVDPTQSGGKTKNMVASLASTNSKLATLFKRKNVGYKSTQDGR